MNKKILLSVLTIGAVLAAVGAGTYAYLDDSEKSTGNTFSAGTIDLSVDSGNPWSNTGFFTIADMKPSVTHYKEVTLKNEGVNPAVIWKQIKINSETTGLQSEPECEAEGGQWNNTDHICTGMSHEDNVISKVIAYDMEITPEGKSPITIIPESWGLTVADVNSLWIPLGTIEPGKTLKVKQSYHMKADTGNWAQGDVMAFDVEFYAEQRLGPGPAPTSRGVVLENKTSDPDWYSVMDGIWGISLRNGTTLDFQGFGLESGKTYRLAYANDPYSSFTEIANGVAGGDGKLTLSGTIPASLTKAKIWLLYGPSGWGNNLKNLWEANLITY